MLNIIFYPFFLILFSFATLNVSFAKDEYICHGSANMYGLAKTHGYEVEYLTINDSLYTPFCNKDIEFLSLSFPNLKKINFEDNQLVDDAALDHLVNLSQLESIRFSRTHKITDKGLQKLCIVTPNIKELIIETEVFTYGRGRLIHGTTLAEVLAKCPIETLVLSSLEISKESWSSILSESLRLKKLSLSFLPTLTPEALISMTGKAPQLQELTLQAVYLGEDPDIHWDWTTFFASFPLTHVSFGYHVDKTGGIFLGLQIAKPDLYSLELGPLREGPSSQVPAEWPSTDLLNYPYPHNLKRITFRGMLDHIGYGSHVERLGQCLRSVEVVVFNSSWLNRLDGASFSGFYNLKEVHINDTRESEGEIALKVKRWYPNLQIFRNDIEL